MSILLFMSNSRLSYKFRDNLPEFVGFLISFCSHFHDSLVLCSFNLKIFESTRRDCLRAHLEFMKVFLSYPVHSRTYEPFRASKVDSKLFKVHSKIGLNSKYHLAELRLLYLNWIFWKSKQKFEIKQFSSNTHRIFPFWNIFLDFSSKGF